MRKKCNLTKYFSNPKVKIYILRIVCFSNWTTIVPIKFTTGKKNVNLLINYLSFVKSLLPFLSPVISGKDNFSVNFLQGHMWIMSNGILYYIVILYHIIIYCLKGTRNEKSREMHKLYFLVAECIHFVDEVPFNVNFKPAISICLLPHGES